MYHSTSYLPLSSTGIYLPEMLLSEIALLKLLCGKENYDSIV
jgi:hypothetical protein